MQKLIQKTTLTLITAGVLTGCSTLPGQESHFVPIDYTQYFDQDRLLPGRSVVVRTFVSNANQPTEIPADCRLHSEEIQAEFTTPATVDMPGIEGKPSVLQLTCTSDDVHASKDIDPVLIQNLFIGDPVGMAISNPSGSILVTGFNRWTYGENDASFTIELE